MMKRPKSWGPHKVGGSGAERESLKNESSTKR